MKNAASTTVRPGYLLRSGLFALTGMIILSLFLFPSQPASASSSCSQRLLNVVAHPDDDLLFLSPDLAHHLRNNDCVRTVFVTAADDNNPATYWQSREEGVRSAYALMAQSPSRWKNRTEIVNGHQVHVSELASNPNVSLMFLRLPDGNGDGQGFSNNHYESLQKLWQWKIDTIHAVDGSASYNRQGLTDTLASAMSAFNAHEIHTQDFKGRFGDGDHSDHHSTALFTRRGHREYGRPNVLVGYEDYTTSFKPANIDAGDYAVKNAAFLSYAQHDLAICKTHNAICKKGLFRGWVERQYKVGTEIAGCVALPGQPLIFSPGRKPDFYDSLMRAYFYQPVCY